MSAASGTVWLAVVSPQVEVKIKHGENRGRKLSYYNVVREIDGGRHVVGQAACGSSCRQSAVMEAGQPLRRAAAGGRGRPHRRRGLDGAVRLTRFEIGPQLLAVSRKKGPARVGAGPPGEALQVMKVVSAALGCGLGPGGLGAEDPGLRFGIRAARLIELMPSISGGITAPWW